MTQPTPFIEQDAIHLLDRALELRSGMTAELTKMSFSPDFVSRIANADPLEWISRSDRQKITDLFDGKPILYGELPPEDFEAKALSDDVVRGFLRSSRSPSDEMFEDLSSGLESYRQTINASV